MNDHHEWESDEALSAAANLPAFDAAKREELFAATTRVLRNRRSSRVVMQAAAIILAFVSGMVAMNQFRSPSAPTTGKIPATAGITSAGGSPVKAAVDDSAILSDPEALARAYDAATPGERLSLLKRAGDYALNERGDLRDALDYYRQWLRLADPPTRSKFDGSDSWLLASLKHDQ